MTNELKQIVISVYDNKIKKLQENKEKFIETELYEGITPNDILCEFSRVYKIPTDKLLSELRKLK